MANNVQVAADDIYNFALGVLDEREVDPRDIPLVMASVAHRLESFAIGAYARDAMTAHAGQKTAGEVEDGRH